VHKRRCRRGYADRESKTARDKGELDTGFNTVSEGKKKGIRLTGEEEVF